MQEEIKKVHEDIYLTLTSMFYRQIYGWEIISFESDY